MTTRGLINRLSYFTIEDETMLAEAFAEFDDAVFAITYKVVGTDDVFVTTDETLEAMDRSPSARRARGRRTRSPRTWRHCGWTLTVTVISTSTS